MYSFDRATTTHQHLRVHLACCPVQPPCQASSADDDDGVLARARPVGHAEMTIFMRLLRAAAQKHGLCILVLNDATAAGRPALGVYFASMSDATLWLAQVPGQDPELRIAEVLRSRISATGARCPFRIRHQIVLAA